MTIHHTYQCADPAMRLARQAAIYRRCLLLLQALRT